MKAVIDALNAIDVTSAEQAFIDGGHQAEVDALLTEIIERMRRLDAEGKLDAAAGAIAQAEFTARASEIGERFALACLDAAVRAGMALDAAQNG